jgi:hypothetical protein
MTPILPAPFRKGCGIPQHNGGRVFDQNLAPIEHALWRQADIKPGRFVFMPILGHQKTEIRQQEVIAADQHPGGAEQLRGGVDYRSRLGTGIFSRTETETITSK